MTCEYCKKKVDKKKLYAIVFKEGKEIPYHIECFHKEYTPIEEKIKA